MLLTTQDVLSPSQLKRLGEHKYSCTSNSLLDPLMQPFWNWLVNKVPLWLAPNLITVTGLMVNIITSLIIVFYSPDARQQAPCWTFLLCALGIFVYQSLDAIDGKQARRTGTSSPLGELFDHGCDSISTVFVAISVCVAVQLGTFPAWMFFQCFAAIALFYCAHWQTYVSGTLRFGKIDVTEVQFSIIGLHLISAIFGPTVWATEIPILSVELKLIPVVVALTVTAILFHASFSVILRGGVGKNGSTVAGTSVLSPCIPFGLVVGPAFIIYQKSINNLYEDHPCLYIIAFGLVAAKVTNRLVIAHMTKSEMDYFDSVLIGPAMLFLNQYFNTAINEYVVLWLCLIWSTFDLLRYCTKVCNQICQHLSIHLFKITPKIPTSVTTGKADESPPSYLQAMATNENEERNSSEDELSFPDDQMANQQRQPFLP